MGTTTFKNAKVGDRVWLLTDMNWHKITSITLDIKYPITLDNKQSFTYGGNRFDIEKQALFWDEVEIVAPEKPLPELEINARVIVWNDENIKYHRHFSHFDKKGNMVCFDKGKTSWTSSKNGVIPWKNWVVTDEF